METVSLIGNRKLYSMRFIDIIKLAKPWRTNMYTPGKEVNLHSSNLDEVFKDTFNVPSMESKKEYQHDTRGSIVLLYYIFI